MNDLFYKESQSVCIEAGIHVFALSIDEIDRNGYERFLQNVSLCRREKALKYKNLTDSVRTVCGELLLRYGISQKYKKYISVEALHFQFTDYGKPYISGSNKLFFNISHSGRWVVCAVSGCEIGIDIEKIDTFIDLNLAEHCFHKKEIGSINTETEDKYELFFHFWTAKESYIKCTGKGLFEPLNHFCIFEDSVVHDGLPMPHKLFFYNGFHGYSMSICSSCKSATFERISLVTINDIVQMLDRG